MAAMAYGKISEKILQELKAAAGEENLLTSPESLDSCSRDETEDLKFLPEVVVRVINTEQLSRVLKLCTRYIIPVTPRGGGTGLSGGALPVFGGVVLSTEKLNRILEIDMENLVAVVEPGVITEVLQNEVEKMGLFYPPDPASRGSCFIGGNVAENAGGPRALKYGVTKDYVLGLEAVLPNGDIIRTGGKLFKDVTGYNLTGLFVGSEGTLGVVTKIILKLLPLPKYKWTLLVPFKTIRAAATAVTKIFHNKIIPCACEFMESSAYQAAEKKLDRRFVPEDAQAALLIEVDGSEQDMVEREAQKVSEVCLECGALDVLLAETPEKQKDLWQMRRAVGEAVKSISIYKEEDTVVPRARIPELMEVIHAMQKKYGITAICYGHAGDGNIHVNIIKENMPDEKWDTVLPEAISELFTEVVKLGGTLSGEHGIGYTQKNYMPIAFSPEELSLMRRIKDTFDPDHILNPGKILPDGD